MQQRAEAAVTPIRRKRLETQGFVGLDDATLARIAPWLRFTPALFGLCIAIGTLLASAPILWGAAIIAAFGAVFPAHLFDLLYNYGVRHLTRTPPLPRNAPQRRLACGIAAMCVAVTAMAFQSGATWLGYVLGALVLTGPLVVATTDVCLPSLLYGRILPLGCVRRR